MPPKNKSLVPPGEVTPAYGDFTEFPSLKVLVREKSKKALELMADAGLITLAELPNRDDFIYGTKIAFILIHSDQLKLTFKAHYFHKTPLAGIPYLRGSDVDSKDPLADWMREYCNMSSGLISETLFQNKIQAHMTTPFSTEGFDETFFSDKVWPSEHRDWWELRWRGGSFICSTSCRISDRKRIASIDAQLVDGNERLTYL